MKKLLYFLAAIALLTGCETDLDIIGEYKDITVVYGLLNQNDTEHVLRIEKAFLGKEPALQMATNADSLYYDTTKISVKIIDSDNNEILFHPTLVEKKDSGGFYYGEKEILYKATANLQASKDYTLVITKANDTATVTANTPLVKDFLISTPNEAPQAKINFLQGADNYISYSTIFRSAENGISHRLTIRFYYREVYAANPNDTINKYIDWIQPIDDAPSAEGGEPIQRAVNGEDFYRFLKANITAYDVNTNNVKRFAGKGVVTNGVDAVDHLDFIIDVGGEELFNYIELNKPSLGVAQDKPVYTNVTNGIGIFSCRYQKSVVNKQFNQASLDELKSGQYTDDLNFVQ